MSCTIGGKIKLQCLVGRSNCSELHCLDKSSYVSGEIWQSFWGQSQLQSSKNPAASAGLSTKYELFSTCIQPNLKQFKLKRFIFYANLVPIMELDITGDNWLHDVKGFQFLTRKFADVYHQLTNLLFLSCKLSLIRQVLRFTSSTIRSIFTWGIHKIPVRRYCLYLNHLQLLRKASTRFLESRRKESKEWKKRMIKLP